MLFRFRSIDIQGIFCKEVASILLFREFYTGEDQFKFMIFLLLI